MTTPTVLNEHPKVLRLEENKRGRDFVVGDIHGMFSTLDQLLMDIKFDSDCDRLISVGDLIDRGKESTRSLEFLDKPWFYSIMGNHESMLLKSFDDKLTFKNWTEQNGGKWWLDIDDNTKQQMREAFTTLPYAMEIATAKGKIGVVHAGVTTRTHWNTFLEKLETDENVQDYALWTRAHYDRFNAVGNAETIAGVKYVIVGHTPTQEPIQAGNIRYIDTGAVYNIKRLGNLTALQIHPTLEYFSCPAQQKKKKSWLFG